MTRSISGRRRSVPTALTWLFTLFLAAILALATACGGGGTGPRDDGPPRGTLQLQMIEEIPLPVRIYQGPWGDGTRVYIIHVNSGTLELSDDGNFEMLFDLWKSKDGLESTSTWRIHGGYEIIDDEIKFRLPNLGDLWGTIDHGVVEVSLNVGGTGDFFTYSFGR